MTRPQQLKTAPLKDYGGGFRPKKDEGRRKSEPSALCPRTSAFQGGSLGKTLPLLPLPFSRLHRLMYFTESRTAIVRASHQK